MPRKAIGSRRLTFCSLVPAFYSLTNIGGCIGGCAGGGGSVSCFSNVSFTPALLKRRKRGGRSFLC